MGPIVSRIIPIHSNHIMSPGILMFIPKILQAFPNLCFPQLAKIGKEAVGH
jgi:hypothetical protein